MQSTVRRERLEKMLLLTILGCLEGVKSGAVMLAKDYEECVERFWLEEYLG